MRVSAEVLSGVRHYSRPLVDMRPELASRCTVASCFDEFTWLAFIEVVYPKRANASHRTVFGRSLIADGQLFESAGIGKGASFAQAGAFRHQHAMVSWRSLRSLSSISQSVDEEKWKTRTSPLVGLQLRARDPHGSDNSVSAAFKSFFRCRVIEHQILGFLMKKESPVREILCQKIRETVI